LPIQTSPTTLQPNYYLPQQFSHTPYSWEAYSYLFYPAYPPSPTYLWTTYGYGIAPWYAIPFPYPGYGYRTHGYEYQPYCIFPFSTFPRSINEELSTLEVYREELQAEIEALDARIEELRRQLSVAGRR
jgi:hypothetical protein